MQFFFILYLIIFFLHFVDKCLKFSIQKFQLTSTFVKNSFTCLQGVRDLLKAVLEKAQGIKSANNVSVMNQLRAIQKVTYFYYSVTNQLAFLCVMFNIDF